MTEESPGRGKNGRFMRTADTAERDAAAVRLRAQGLGLREIAEHLGFSQAAGAHKAIERALRDVPTPAVQELRQLECERLDALARDAWEIAHSVRLVVANNGRTVEGPDGTPMRDDGPTLAALNLLLKITDRRSRLLGLDAAKKYEVRQQVVTLDAIDAAIADLQRQIGEYPEPNTVADRR